MFAFHQSLHQSSAAQVEVATVTSTVTSSSSTSTTKTSTSTTSSSTTRDGNASDDAETRWLFFLVGGFKDFLGGRYLYHQPVILSYTYKIYITDWFQRFSYVPFHIWEWNNHPNELHHFSEG